VTDPVHNERIKLISALFNTMANTSFTVGVAAPIATAVFYKQSIWTLVAGLLHLLTQAILGRLRA
jgi:VIT1/CCC1 family predicted Fe2+/Mn2+ transporter